MYTVRSFSATDREYRAIAAIHDAVWPGQSQSGAIWKAHDDGRNPRYFFQRVVVETSGRVVAHGHCGENPWSHLPGKYTLDFAVHPHYRCRGLATAGYRALLTLLARRDPAPTLLTASTRDDQVGAVAFLAQQGFAQVLREPTSTLDVAAFDDRPFRGLLDRVRQAGITIHSFTELRALDPDWKRVWYDLEGEINRDVPQANAGAQLPFETFAGYLEGALVDTDAYFVAVDQAGRAVGLSGLDFSARDPAVAQTGGLTGVVRSHRRRGIATALKLRAITLARVRGIRRIHTSNEEHNPMYRLNLGLGFAPGPAWLRFEKRLRGGVPEAR